MFRRTKLENYLKSLNNEIKARSALIAALEQADAFYHNQRGEVKVVATAYREFGNRIKTMKRKVEDLAKTLPSPIPSPDMDAPSPGPADEFVLPGEKGYDSVSDSNHLIFHINLSAQISCQFDFVFPLFICI